MKISVATGIMGILAVAIVYTVLRPDGNTVGELETQLATSSQTMVETALDVPETAQKTDAQKQQVSRENRRKEILETFAELQQSRKKLKSYANLLKSKIWGLELPAQQARDVSHKMRRAYAYLKNPTMLGGYIEPGEIRNEIGKVEAMLLDLKEVERLIGDSQHSED